MVDYTISIKGMSSIPAYGPSSTWASIALSSWAIRPMRTKVDWSSAGAAGTAGSSIPEGGGGSTPIPTSGQTWPRSS